MASSSKFYLILSPRLASIWNRKIFHSDFGNQTSRVDVAQLHGSAKLRVPLREQVQYRLKLKCPIIALTYNWYELLIDPKQACTVTTGCEVV